MESVSRLAPRGSPFRPDQLGDALAVDILALRLPFWSIDIASAGTVHTLAIEAESSRTSSTSILAIAPDCTALSTTTIIDPLATTPLTAVPPAERQEGYGG
jgi:hypothetical protein